jgi:misacylated tRNA(Ala) deacylase
VVDVAKSGGSVLHRVRGPPAALRSLTVGAVVDGEIDWARRYRHMRLHTAQHLSSAIVFRRTRLRTRKANLAGTSATIDLEGPLGAAEVEPLATELAAAVGAALPVAIRHVPRVEWDSSPSAPRSGLVPLPPQVDPVRVIEIVGLDLCPCGGTHVRSTGEIGGVRFAPPVSRPDGGTRLEFTLVEPDRPTPTA